MHPLRILILAVLLYILYRLIVGGIKRKGVGSGAKKGRGGELPVQDVLVEDPVCHTYVPKGQSVVLKQGGQAVYFCSEKCRKEYLEQKEKGSE